MTPRPYPQPAGKATITSNGGTWEVPALKAGDGTTFIYLGDKTTAVGLAVFDPGLVRTAPCSSELSFVDGKRGKLFYRGLGIQDCTKKSFFWNVMYLLKGGDPTAAEVRSFKYRIVDAIRKNIETFPENIPPMQMLQTSFARLRLEEDGLTAEAAAIQVFAAMYVASAAIIRETIKVKTQVVGFKNPLRDWFMLALNHEATDEEVKALETFLILHLDHGLNASTFAARLLASTGASIPACLSGAIGALSGHLHGGANVDVMELLGKIKSGEDSIEAVIARAKNPNIKELVPGIGHRVYRIGDPRAAALKQQLEIMLEGRHETNELFEIARKLEALVLSDPYFTSRRIYPNVDFYSGILLSLLGIPVQCFTVMFAFGRVIGWLAHIFEQRSAIGIIRPLHLHEDELPE